jgi:hypothetical protein
VSLAITAKPNKTELVLGEPLLVDLSIANTGKDTVKIGHAPDIGSIWISKDGKSYKKFSRYGRGRARKNPYSLAPGKTVTTHFFILYGTLMDSPEGGGTKVHEYAFPTAGTYFIRGGVSVARTDPIEITVKEPVGEDAVVWAKLREVKEYGRFMYLTGWRVEQEPMPTFVAIVDAFPNSVYSHYLALALGKKYLGHLRHVAAAGKPQKSPEFTETWQQALNYLRKAAAMKQVPAVREEAMWLGAQNGAPEDVVKICEQALKEIPNSRFKAHFEAWRASAQERLEPRWQDPFFRVSRELKGLGYNLALTPELQEKLDRDVTEMNRAAKQSFRDKKITGRELREIQVENFRQWVLKNLTPQPPPAQP